MYLQSQHQYLSGSCDARTLLPMNTDNFVNNLKRLSKFYVVNWYFVRLILIVSFRVITQSG